MNHIARLQADNRALIEQIARVRDELVELEVYLTSDKFAAPDADYVHVRTDILPKIRRLKMEATP